MLHVGISTQVSSDGRLKRLALATCDAVTLISVESKEQSWMKMRDTALAGLLRSGPVLVGFGIARIALQIHHDIRVHINNGVDLSTLCSLSTREPWSPSKLVGTRLCPMASFSKIDRLWYGGAESEHSEREVVLRAWISAMYVIYDPSRSAQQELSILENLVVQSDALAAHEPKETPNDFIRGVMTTEGMKLENARYQNRVRKSHQTSVIMTNEHGQEFTGRADGSNGRVTDIKFDHAVLTGDLAAVRVVGKQELTNSEKARDEFLLLALRGELKITDGPFIRLLWLSGPEQRGELSAPTTRGTIATRVAGLNASQMRALDRMTSSMPIVIVQGPPGTGKTKTISAAAAVWEELGSPVWIVAQSNVAVKNIAQKLADLEITFKIVVSKEFYVEWHEHIYGPIEDFLIRTDELMADQRGIVHILSGARIVLSTLSTLSNPGLDQVGIFSLVPLERLVVDEASQINAFDFMHVFFKFRKSLQKVCFFGDPQQLPPYGQDQAPTLKSIFEFQHLQILTEFLDTQYRMPIPIGQFISHCVYEGKLSSQHDIESMDCLAFIDARGAETSSGLSWKNPKEMQTICYLVRRYTQTGKKFCIITPYDAQRAAIERQLKDENLPHEAVYNVDFFQGA
ncbi:P-loop containing nucleoside triphosphate hydrolase protein [Mycena galericulata]|nr:P-loop containing nucleoside triphosphate hydrolase protein [Mycena galericulata]